MSLLKPYLTLDRNRLTSLINNDNDFDLVEGVDFTYGDTRSITGPNNTNTLVTLIPLPGSKLHQPLDVYYNRLSISVVKESFYKSIEPVYIPSVPFWTSSALPEINRVFGLNLTVYDIIDTLNLSKEESYALIINPSRSLIWLPGVLEFKVTTSKPELKDLSIAIDHEFFDGFDADLNPIGNAFDSNILDGFTADKQKLCETIEDIVLDGFQFNETLLSSKIVANNLDGFEGGDRSLRTCIYDTQLNGFAMDFEYA